MEPFLVKQLQSVLHLKQTKVAEWSATSPREDRIVSRSSDGRLTDPLEPSTAEPGRPAQEVWWSLLRAVHRCTRPAPDPNREH